MPDSLKDQMSSTFRCCICQVIPIRPLVVVSNCCGNILGCKECTEQLNATSQDEEDEPSCLLCGNRELSTRRLNGLDGFLTAVSGYLHNTETQTS